MSALWPLLFLSAVVGIISLAGRTLALRRVFRWLPVPLWCYALPALAVAGGWLPSAHPVYQHLTGGLLPVALGLLLLGVDVVAIGRTGSRALIAAVIGTAGILIGALAGAGMLRAFLPAEAWKGAGALAATWTGGTMNLLAVRSVLEVPEAIFAPLILVDALIAYAWMALLIAASSFQSPFNRWLGAERLAPNPSSRQMASAPEVRSSLPGSLLLCGLIALALTGIAWALAKRLPSLALISSPKGWVILLVTTGALMLSLIPPLRRLTQDGDRLGYPCLYLVLAATGAQAQLSALWSAPVWIGLGAVMVSVHGFLMILAGRLFRIPLGLLATASQANIGGVVSAPLVGAVYDQSLVPIGLLLAIAGNALGTYAGLLASGICRWFAPG